MRIREISIRKGLYIHIYIYPASNIEIVSSPTIDLRVLVSLRATVWDLRCRIKA